MRFAMESDNTKKISALEVSGMGPIILESGVAFRLWAPNADSVNVIGSFNDWDNDADPMNREENGSWSIFIEQAKPGDEYKYLIKNGEQTFQRLDPRVREVTNSVGNGIVHNPNFDWEGDDFTIAPCNELVIYETHIGTFFREDEDKVGTFSDFSKKFDHLKKLGVNALQIMPIAEFSGDLSWGYNPALPYAVESAYGGPTAFKTFVREAHKAGFAIILDVVYNHFGPSDLELWRFDGWSENDSGGIYFYNDHRSATPWGNTRPDYGRGEVRTYIRDNAIMWLEDYHVDGLRFDMTLYMRSVDANAQEEIPDGWGLTQWINHEVKQYKPSAITIAEDLQNNNYLTKQNDEGGAGFSTQWDANFVHPIREVLTQSDDTGRDMYKVRDALYHQYNGDAFQRVVYTESHDEVANGKARIPTEVDSEHPDNYFAQKRSLIGLVLTLTSPGIPMLFQGQEFLEAGWFKDTDELDWEKAQSQNAMVELTSKLISLRLNHEGVTKGLTGNNITVFHINNHDKVIAYRRYYSGGSKDDCIIMINFSNNSLSQYAFGLPNNGTWNIRFNSNLNEDIKNADMGLIEAIDESYDGLPSKAIIDIPPYTAFIFSQ
jgi:1,4-alpha-glucan branching enzyme